MVIFLCYNGHGVTFAGNLSLGRGSRMRTFINESTDPFYNQAFEEFVFENFAEDDVFYLWQNRPAIVVGCYQNICREVNVHALRRRGVPVVRRMSGGGTIYTDLGGWQFTFIQHRDAGEIQFHEYIAPVIDALREMGVNASFNGRNDLTIDGRKFSGNAQYRLGDSIVHHGSLLFDTDIEQMVASTTVDDYKILSKSIKSVRDRVTNIAEHLPSPMDPHAFKAGMVRHIMNGSTEQYSLTPGDDARIRQLAREKFAAWECIFGADPKFNIERTGRFAGGKMEFKIDVRKGVIQSASVYGDFFSTLDAKTICDALVGSRYERESVRGALLEHGIEGKIYRITVDEMAALIAD